MSRLSKGYTDTITRGLKTVGAPVFAIYLEGGYSSTNAYLFVDVSFKTMGLRITSTSYNKIVSIEDKTPAQIASEFSADRGFVNLHMVCNFRLYMSCFQKYVNLVSLFLGKLRVGSHLCSFDVVV